MDFQQFITEQKKTHAPWCKYEELNDVALVVLLSTFWVLRLWCALRILCASGLSLKKAYDEAHRIATKLTPEGLNRLYTIHPRETPLTLLVLWGCNSNDISTELTKRTERYPLSREIIRYKMRKPGAPWMISLLKLAEVDELTTHKPYIEDDEDLQMLGLKAVVKCHRRLGQKIMTHLKKHPIRVALPDPSSLDLPTANLQQVDAFCLKVLKKHTEISLRDLLPVLSGDLEREAPEYARQKLRNHYRKRDRRLSKQVKGDVEELEGAGKLSRDGQTVKRLPRDNHMEGIERTFEALFQDSYERINDILDGRRALEIIRRLPENRRRFFHTLAETDDITKASGSGPVSRQMGHRYRLEMRRKLTQGTPQKKKK